MMQNYMRGLGSALVLLILAESAGAASVDIEWLDPGKYRDIRAGNEGQKNFEERVTAALTRSFEDAAADHLPQEQTLRLTITDVDLAGDIEYFFLDFPDGIRVMRDVYFPSISFAYELVDAEGKVIKQGAENIKDMGYRFSGTTFISDPPFNYEDRLIHDWISKLLD
jgi:hypothetical protein